MNDPKPPKRYRATSREWEEIRAYFAADRCWVCAEPWTELHHLVNRSHSGDDVTVNLVPLCGECHRRVEARDRYPRSQIRQALMPSNLGYLRYKLGEEVDGWLERNYTVKTEPVPDELWDALVAELGEVATKTERGERNAALKELREVGATAEDIHSRCRAYRRKWPDMALTASALKKHWSSLQTQPSIQEPVEEVLDLPAADVAANLERVRKLSGSIGKEIA